MSQAGILVLTVALIILLFFLSEMKKIWSEVKKKEKQVHKYDCEITLEMITNLNWWGTTNNDPCPIIKAMLNAGIKNAENYYLRAASTRIEGFYYEGLGTIVAALDECYNKGKPWPEDYRMPELPIRFTIEISE